MKFKKMEEFEVTRSIIHKPFKEKRLSSLHDLWSPFLLS